MFNFKVAHIFACHGMPIYYVQFSTHSLRCDKSNRRLTPYSWRTKNRLSWKLIDALSTLNKSIIMLLSLIKHLIATHTKEYWSLINRDHLTFISRSTCHTQNDSFTRMCFYDTGELSLPLPFIKKCLCLGSCLLFVFVLYRQPHFFILKQA